MFEFVFYISAGLGFGYVVGFLRGFTAGVDDERKQIEARERR